MSYAFNGTNPNLNYAVNRLNRNNNVFSTLLNSLRHGGATVSPNASVEAAVQWAIDRQSHAGEMHYSQGSDRWADLKNPNGTAYDCSSFVITAYYVGGIDINATWTGDMKEAALAVGFEWIPGSTFSSEELVRGDILLNENSAPINGHTQIYIGDGEDITFGGDPCSRVPHDCCNYGTWWDGVLRYVG